MDQGDFPQQQQQQPSGPSLPPRFDWQDTAHRMASQELQAPQRHARLFVRLASYQLKRDRFEAGDDELQQQQQQRRRGEQRRQKQRSGDGKKRSQAVEARGVRRQQRGPRPETSEEANAEHQRDGQESAGTPTDDSGNDAGMEDGDDGGDDIGVGAARANASQLLPPREFSMPQSALRPVMDFMDAQRALNSGGAGGVGGDGNNGMNSDDFEIAQQRLLREGNAQVIFRLVGDSSSSSGQNGGSNGDGGAAAAAAASNQQFRCAAVSCSDRGDVVLDIQSTGSNGTSRRANRFADPQQLGAGTKQRLRTRRSDIAGEKRARGVTFADEADEQDPGDAGGDASMPERVFLYEAVAIVGGDRRRGGGGADVLSARGAVMGDMDLAGGASAVAGRLRKIDDGSDPFVVSKNATAGAEKTISRDAAFGPLSVPFRPPAAARHGAAADDDDDDDDGGGTANAAAARRRAAAAAASTLLDDDDNGEDGGLPVFTLEGGLPLTFDEMRPALQHELQCIDALLWGAGDETVGRREEAVFRGICVEPSLRPSRHIFVPVDDDEDYEDDYFGSGPAVRPKQDDLGRAVDAFMLTKKQRQLINEARPPRRVRRKELLYAPTVTGDEYDSNAEDAVEDYGEGSEDDDEDGLDIRATRNNGGANRGGRNRAGDDDDDNIDDADDDDWTASSTTVDENNDFEQFGDEDDDAAQSLFDAGRMRRAQLRSAAAERQEQLLPTAPSQPRRSQQPFPSAAAATAAARGAGDDDDDAAAVATGNAASSGVGIGMSRAAYEAAEDEFLLQEQMAEFDPFRDADNDPHIYIDAEGQAYVAGW